MPAAPPLDGALPLPAEPAELEPLPPPTEAELPPLPDDEPPVAPDPFPPDWAFSTPGSFPAEHPASANSKQVGAILMSVSSVVSSGWSGEARGTGPDRL